jgi:CheY-like chemotaxis protein
MNLATNARDAMPSGGNLTITTDLMSFDYEYIKAHGYGTPGRYAFISFYDTGKGMNKETEERIFEPFFTTKEVGKGTGLGLSMVYGIIQQHDGYINVYSEPNKGTTFEIYIPLIKSTLEEGHEVTLTTMKRGTETVLVAEDDAQVRDLIREVLAGFGYTVLEAHDGESALRLFSEHKDQIHILILDVVMPKKNGKQIYDDIKKTQPNIKCLFTSGYDANIIHKKGILEENLPFLSKPISPEELLTKVREILDSD